MLYVIVTFKELDINGNQKDWFTPTKTEVLRFHLNTNRALKKRFPVRRRGILTTDRSKTTKSRSIIELCRFVIF